MTLEMSSNSCVLSNGRTTKQPPSERNVHTTPRERGRVAAFFPPASELLAETINITPGFRVG